MPVSASKIRSSAAADVELLAHRLAPRLSAPELRVLGIRRPAETGRHAVRHVEEAGHLGDVHHVLVAPARLAKRLDVRLGHLDGSPRELHGVVEHRHLARLETRRLVARREPVGGRRVLRPACAAPPSGRRCSTAQSFSSETTTAIISRSTFVSPESPFMATSYQAFHATRFDGAQRVEAQHVRHEAELLERRRPQLVHRGRELVRRRHAEPGQSLVDRCHARDRSARRSRGADQS